jgi:phosphonate transport system permease protein
MNVASISLLVFVLLALGSAKVLRGSGRDLDYFGNLARFLGRFFPPDFSVTSSVLAALGETIQIALVATLLAVILSLPLAIAGAQTISPRWLVMLVGCS